MQCYSSVSMHGLAKEKNAMKRQQRGLLRSPDFIRKDQGFSIWLPLSIILGLIILFSGVSFPDTSGYSVHIGSFKIMDNALNARHQAESMGYESIINTKDDPRGGVWHQVLVGRYNTKSEAQTGLLQMQRDQLSDYYAVLSLPRSRKTAKKSPQEQLVSTAPTSKTITKQSPPPAPSQPHPTASSQSTFQTASSPPPMHSAPAQKNAVYGSPVQHNPTHGTSVQSRTPFTLSITSGWSMLPKIKNFRITQTVAPNATWSIADDETGFVGIDAGWQFTDMFSVQGGVKTELFEDIDLYYLELGPKVSFDLMPGFEAHLRAGGVYGIFDWDHVPGSFDNGMGWFAGYGLLYKYHKFRLGLDFTYRRIDFDYSPDGAGVAANQSNIDFTGALFSGSLGYQF